MHGLMHMPGTAARLAAGQRSLTPAECDSFREDGFVIVRSVFDPAEIAELRDGFDCLLDLLAPAAGGGAAKAALLPSIYFKVQAGSEDARAPPFCCYCIVSPMPLMLVPSPTACKGSPRREGRADRARAAGAFPRGGGIRA